MPTTVTSTLRASGGDYTSLSGWAAGIQKDLVTNDLIQVLECYDDWASGLDQGSSSYEIRSSTGWTTSATNHVIIRAASGHGNGGDPAAGFFIYGSNVTGGPIRNVRCHVKLEGLRIGATSAGPYGRVGNFLDASGQFTHVDKCVFGSLETSSVATGALFRATNCLCLGGTSAAKGYRCANFPSVEPEAQFINCGFAHYSDLCTVRVAVNNCWEVDTGGFYLETGVTGDYCASEDTSAPGANSLHNITAANCFVDPTNDNFFLKSGSPLIGAGANYYSTFTTDINGDTWPSSGAWDIGADYYTSGSPDVTLPLTGTASTTSSGVLSPGLSLALAGTSVAASAGTVTATVGINVALSGIESIAAAGTISTQASVALSGGVATVSAGAITAVADGSTTVALSGASATFATGALVSASGVALSGTSSSIDAGTVSVLGATTLTAADLAAIDALIVARIADIAAATLAAAQVTPIHADARAIVGKPLAGNGVPGDEFHV